MTLTMTPPEALHTEALHTEALHTEALHTEALHTDNPQVRSFLPTPPIASELARSAPRGALREAKFRKGLESVQENSYGSAVFGI